MEAKAESSKHMGRERTNSSVETVGTEQMRWEGECGNVTSPFVILGVTGFSDNWEERKVTIAGGREAPTLGRDSACFFLGIPASPETHWKFKMALLESDET